MDWRRFQALTFDCYGTLIDWESGLRAALRPWAARHRLAVGDGALLAAFGAAESAIEADNPALAYPEVLRAALEALGRRFDAPPNAAEAAAFAASVKDWPAFPDSPETLLYLTRHYRLVIVSNVDRASFAHSNRRLGTVFDAIVTADDVGSYKPDPAHFHAALRHLAAFGIERDAVLHVAQSLFHDHAPAKRLGLTTAWINRGHAVPGPAATPAPAVPVQPDLELPTLAALAEAHRAAFHPI